MDFGLLFERPKVGNGDLFDMHDDGWLNGIYILNQQRQQNQKRAMKMMAGGLREIKKSKTALARCAINSLQ